MKTHGMACIFCHHPETFIIDVRETHGYTANRRRRECRKCKERFTTIERVAREETNG